MDLIGQGKQPNPKLSAWKVLLKTLWENGKAGLSTGRAWWWKRLGLKEGLQKLLKIWPLFVMKKTVWKTGWGQHRRHAFKKSDRWQPALFQVAWKGYLKTENHVRVYHSLPKWATLAWRYLAMALLIRLLISPWFRFSFIVTRLLVVFKRLIINF